MAAEEQVLEDNQMLRRRVKYLEAILEAHHVSKLETNIAQLRICLRTNLRQIVAELQAAEHAPENVQHVEELIGYFEDAIMELSRFKT